jgi:elongation factor 2
MGESQQVDPVRGTVAFGSALFGWAFTLLKFSRMYAEKFKLDNDKMIAKLWGDNYHDAKAKKFKQDETADDGTQLKRMFVQFVMEPIIRLCRNIMDNNKEAVWKMLGHLEITLKNEEKEMQGKPLFKLVF